MAITVSYTFLVYDNFDSFLGSTGQVCCVELHFIVIYMMFFLIIDWMSLRRKIIVLSVLFHHIVSRVLIINVIIDCIIGLKYLGDMVFIRFFSQSYSCFLCFPCPALLKVSHIPHLRCEEL